MHNTRTSSHLAAGSAMRKVGAHCSRDRWSHTLVLPISYPSLLITAQLAFTIWDIEGTGKAVPVGGTTMRLFTDRRYVNPPLAICLERNAM